MFYEYSYDFFVVFEIRQTIWLRNLIGNFVKNTFFERRLETLLGEHLHLQRFHLCQMTPWQALQKEQI